jgi:putative transposase
MTEARPRYTRNAGAVFSLKYHVVWCPKYRRPVLTPPVDARLKQLIEEVALEHDFTVHEMEVMPDHVHLFVECDPTRSVAEIVNRFKGATSRFLREEFPHLRSRLPTLWSRSYYAGTVGHVSEATVRAYIESQKGK